MNRKEIHTRIHYYSAMLFACTLPIAKMMQLFIIILMLNWIIEGDFINKFKAIYQNKYAKIFITFYLIHVVGLLYTENMYAGLFDIQIKLSLLFFPIFFCSRPLTNENVKNIFYAFIVGGVVSSFIMLSVATYTYLKTGENNFFYESFSFLIHPSYLAMYLNFSIAWILLNLLNAHYARFISKTLSFVIVVFFSAVIVLLSSKLGLLTWMMTMIGFLMYYIFSRKKYMLGLVGLAFVGLSVFAVLRFVPEISARLKNAISAITTTASDNANAESTAVRMLVWKASNQVIKNNWIGGVGTGDSKDELMKEYSVEGMKGAEENRLNCHNEFYQVTVTLGIAALFIFLLHLFVPLKYAMKNGKSIYALFILIITINFLTESMLETQAGVMFFAFFNSVLCFQILNPKS